MCLRYAPAKCGKFVVLQCFFQFRYRYLEIRHLLYCTISYVNESRRWQTFSLFALSELVYSLFSLSELVYTKKVFYPIFLFPLLSHPKLLPLWSVTDGQKDRFQHPLLPKFFLALPISIICQGISVRRLHLSYLAIYRQIAETLPLATLCSLGHPPHSSASPVELRLRVGHRAQWKKKELR